MLAVNDLRHVNGRYWDHHHEVRHGERTILCMICPCKVIMPVPRLTAQIERDCAQIKDSSSIGVPRIYPKNMSSKLQTEFLKIKNTHHVIHISYT